MVLVAFLVFLLSTIHLGVDHPDDDRLNSGFILFCDSYSGGPVAWFANPSDPSFVFKNAGYTFQTALGDSVLVGGPHRIEGNMMTQTERQTL
ncbi:hypothetical protein C8R43DRAFT_984036 [Mycena crocata]|nr:hypothetical protein C8R43DRAFT_984036 [Mycena crocata]